MTRTYTFLFDPDPDGGYVVTCPALPGLVTHGATMDEARGMALDAMEGMIDTMIEDGASVPESDPPFAVKRFDSLARALRGEEAPTPLFEQISTRSPAAA